MKENKQLLVLNCSSGISGDMTVAALIDLGADGELLKRTLATLPLEGAEVKISRVVKSGLDACDFAVLLDAEHENHDHDMAYLHPDHPHAHMHEPEGHPHAHTHEHAAHSHAHAHVHSDHHHGRNLADITAILQAGELTPHALELALRIFRIVAEAEAKVHGKSIDEVHFHEVGAVDSILDIAAAAICIDNLGITDCVVTDLTEGTGTVRCQHGLLPIPVPATTEILKRYGLPLHIAAQVQGELVTPTGAAIAAALHTRDRLPESFRIVRTGLGAGKRDYPVAGVVRAMLVQETSGRERETLRGTCAICETAPELTGHNTLWELQTNVDDCTGEALGFTMEELLAAGAYDVFYTPICMKKSRPACLLSVICSEQCREKLEDIIFRNTTTIGIRRIRCGRTRLERRMRTVETPWGKADVKICAYPERTRESEAGHPEEAGTSRSGPEGKEVLYPEADSVARLARENGIGFSQMYHLLKAYCTQIC